LTIISSTTQKIKHLDALKKIATIDKYKYTQSEEIGKKILAYTPLLYKKMGNRKDRPEPIASSFLLKFENSYFLITASHVVPNGNITGLGLFFNSTFFNLDGECLYTKTKNIEDDKLDILIVKLSELFIKEIGAAFLFFDINNINVDIADVSGDCYLVIGYPITRIKLNIAQKKELKFPFIFRTNIQQQNKIHKHLKTNENYNLIFYYGKHDIQNSKTGISQEGPKPNGLSGCGVWLITDLLDTTFSSFMPVSMLIEYDAKFNVFVTTRIRLITESIRNKWQIEIQQTKKFHLDLIY